MGIATYSPVRGVRRCAEGTVTAFALTTGAAGAVQAVPGADAVVRHSLRCARSTAS